MRDFHHLENMRRMFEAQLRRSLTPEEFRMLSLSEPLAGRESESELSNGLSRPQQPENLRHR